jgi:hypothetical protein
VNGVFRGLKSVETNYIPTDAGTRIGTSVSSPGGDGFTGLVDEVAIYNRALTSAEILALYNAGAGGKLTGGTPPTITSFLATNTTVSPGGSVRFAATAAGPTPDFNYQWYLDGVPESFGTSAILLLSNVQPRQAGLYTVSVGNSNGTTFADSAAGLTVVETPKLTNGVPYLSIFSVLGLMNRIESLDNLLGTNTWRTVTNIAVNTKPYLFGDTNALELPHRFYRVILP